MELVMQVAQYLLAAAGTVSVIMAFVFGVLYLYAVVGLGDPETRRSREHRMLRLMAVSAVVATMLTVLFLFVLFLSEGW